MTGVGDRDELQRGRERFEELLRVPSREADFQRLFAECPYILSRTLPLRLAPSDIRPLGRPGRSEPDFLALPAAGSPIGSYGVIELKRPDTRILVEPRKGLLILSRDARTAVAQGLTYGRELAPRPVDGRMLMLGNRTQIFVILGLSSELSEKLGSDLYRRQLADELPGECRLIPYDTLLDSFSATIPPRVSVLVAAGPETDLAGLINSVDSSIYSWRRFDLTDASLEYWKAVEDELHHRTGIRGPGVEWSGLEVANGPWAGSLATEADGPREFAGAVLAILRELREAAAGMAASDGLENFVEGYELIAAVLGRRPAAAQVTGEALSTLKEAAARCWESGESSTSLQIGDPVTRELEAHGLVRFYWLDAGEGWYEIHPLSRYLI